MDDWKCRTGLCGCIWCQLFNLAICTYCLGMEDDDGDDDGCC